MRRRILDNELQPGTQMLESEAADLLGMSHTPVREALIVLAEEGLVEIRPRHGMRVKPVSPGDIREIYDVLTSLEATAARLAAGRDLDGEALAGLDKAVNDMEAALAAGNLTAWAEADERFHAELVAASGNKRLIDIVATMTDQVRRVRMATLSLRPLPTKSNEDHAAVVAAIRAGDAERAFVLHRDHRDSAGKMLQENGLDAL